MSATFDPEELALVKRLQAGDNEAWNRFFEAHSGMIYGIVRWPKWRFEMQDWEDVKHEIYGEIIKALRCFECRSSLKTFVYSIAVNTCIARIRNVAALKRIPERHTIPLDPPEADCPEPHVRIPANPSGNPEDMLLHHERLQLLTKVLGTLDKKCKELIRLKFFEGLSFREMEEKLQATQNTLIQRMRRCLARLSDHFQAEY